MAESKKAAAKKTSPAGGKSKGYAAPERGPLGQVFGIRHLSPSGAWHLRKFIEKVDPTAILIEGPSDAGEMLAHLVHKKTKPPVALLAFTKQRPVRSILYPLAEYSPEWVAATVGLRAKRVVRFMDLPASVFLGLQEQDAREAAEKRARAAAGKGEQGEDGRPSGVHERGQVPEHEQEKTETQAYLDDPYEQIAALAGDPDHDTWWEKHFEHTRQDDAYRASIHEFGKGLRELRRDDPRRERETLLREAYMRRVIRETIEEGHDPARVVVVCGAYHSTALVAELPAMTDAELKALPSLPTTLTLMPYSYYRLSSQSGYGAGNHAPGYFQALWEESGEGGDFARLPIRFLSEVAGHLRKAGNVRSSAEVIEAVRLAQTLAALNGEASAPTLRDLRDAAVTCLAHGEENVVAKWLDEVAVGAHIGRVPDGVMRTSLQDDFYRLLKDLKLEEYLKDKEQVIKGNAGDALDLRENRFVKSADAALRDRNRSVFLHRLEVLGIGFAKETTKEADREQSTFKEKWTARWTPECEINLAENSLRGDTVEVAAARTLGEKLAAVTGVGEAAAIAEGAVQCDLPEAATAALARVQQLAVDDASLVSIADALHRLADLVRYKGIVRIDFSPLQPLVSQLFLRATLLAPGATHCDDDAAKKVGHALANVQRVAGFEDWEAILAVERWNAALDAIADDDANNPYIAGVACALLLERGLVGDELLETRVARRISPGTDPAAGAGYFEGLASRNRMALLSRKKLWASLTAFVESLDDDAFRRAVVGLRRAFGAFETGEVRRIGSILAEVWGGGASEIAQALETKLDEKEAQALEEELGDLGDLDL